MPYCPFMMPSRPIGPGPCMVLLVCPDLVEKHTNESMAKAYSISGLADVKTRSDQIKLVDNAVAILEDKIKQTIGSMYNPFSYAAEYLRHIDLYYFIKLKLPPISKAPEVFDSYRHWRSAAEAIVALTDKFIYQNPERATGFDAKIADDFLAQIKLLDGLRATRTILNYDKKELLPVEIRYEQGKFSYNGLFEEIFQDAFQSKSQIWSYELTPDHLTRFSVPFEKEFNLPLDHYHKIFGAVFPVGDPPPFALTGDDLQSFTSNIHEHYKIPKSSVDMFFALHSLTTENADFKKIHLIRRSNSIMAKPIIMAKKFKKTLFMKPHYFAIDGIDYTINSHYYHGREDENNCSSMEMKKWITEIKKERSLKFEEDVFNLFDGLPSRKEYSLKRFTTEDPGKVDILVANTTEKVLHQFECKSVTKHHLDIHEGIQQIYNFGILDGTGYTAKVERRNQIMKENLDAILNDLGITDVENWNVMSTFVLSRHTVVSKIANNYTPSKFKFIDFHQAREFGEMIKPQTPLPSP